MKLFDGYCEEGYCKSGPRCGVDTSKDMFSSVKTLLKVGIYSRTSWQHRRCLGSPDASEHHYWFHMESNWRWRRRNILWLHCLNITIGLKLVQEPICHFTTNTLCLFFLQNFATNFTFQRITIAHTVCIVIVKKITQIVQLNWLFLQLVL